MSRFRANSLARTLGMVDILEFCGWDVAIIQMNVATELFPSVSEPSKTVPGAKQFVPFRRVRFGNSFDNNAGGRKCFRRHAADAWANRITGAPAKLSW